jgi:hypothetical protein
MNAATELNFDEDDLESMTLIEAVSKIITNFADQGCMMEDIAGMILKHFPRWSPNSASPAVSHLIYLNCVRDEHRFGVRKIFHVRAYDETDRHRLSEHTRQQKESSILKKIAKARDEGAAQIAAAAFPIQAAAAKPKETVIVASSKMMIAYGERETLVVTVEHAKEIWVQLKGIFGG